MSSIQNLPKEIHLQIQTYLTCSSVLSYLQVCHVWHDFLSHNELVWVRLFPEITFPESFSPKNYLDLHATQSIEKVLERIEQFALQLLFNQKGALLCLFPFSNDCFFNLELEIFPILERNQFICQTSNDSEKKPTQSTLKKTCICMKKGSNNFSEQQLRSSHGEYYSDRTKFPKILRCKLIIRGNLSQFGAQFTKTFFDKTKNIIHVLLENRVHDLKDIDMVT